MANAPPKTSKTKDTYSHHTSPNSGPPKVQFVGPNPPSPKEQRTADRVLRQGGGPRDIERALNKLPARQVTGKVTRHTIPDHVTKHSNPVGRPRTPRG